MSGIAIHSQDPIKPTEAEGIPSPTAHHAGSRAAPQSPMTTSASQRYIPARPEAAIPTPTSTATPSNSNRPPPPQPGAVPAPHPPTTTAKPSLPPPPKAGEKPQPSGYYTPVESQPTQQPYPPQMSHPPLKSGPTGLPPASVTSTTTTPSFSSAASPASLPVSAETSGRASLEHPPGYTQNPYASELTPNQRFPAEQQQNDTQSETLPSLGYNSSHSRKKSDGLLENDESVFDAAVKWGKQKGKQLEDLHDQVWDSVGRK